MIVDLKKLECFELHKLDHGEFKMRYGDYLIHGVKIGPDMYRKYRFCVFLEEKGRVSKITISNVSDVRDYFNRRWRKLNPIEKRINHPLET